MNTDKWEARVIDFVECALVILICGWAVFGTELMPLQFGAVIITLYLFIRGCEWLVPWLFDKLDPIEDREERLSTPIRASEWHAAVTLDYDPNRSSLVGRK